MKSLTIASRQSSAFISVIMATALWMIAVVAGMLFGSESEFDSPTILVTASFDESKKQSPASESKPDPLPEPRTSQTIGTIQYTGPHTWQAMIEVAADHIAYKDGTITAGSFGQPQGITLKGHRSYVTFKNLTFKGMGDGINIGNDQRADNLLIDNCQFLDCRTPDFSSPDILANGRGYGIFASAGRNWTIRNTVFQAVPDHSGGKSDDECISQYAARLGAIHGLNVSDSKFENCGKPLVWLMFVRAAVFENVEFRGGPFRIGVRPRDLPGVEKGDCRNIIFRNCTFTFGSYEDWPAGILIFPGTDNVVFENCEVTTIPGSTWWLEIDAKETREIQWKNCTWNGEPVEGYRGIRTSLNQEEMTARNIGPIEAKDEPTPAESPPPPVQPQTPGPVSLDH